MDQPGNETPTSPLSPVLPGAEYPPGDHPLEVAARRGIGPLSPKAKEQWHGQAQPCVTCGLLVPRDTAVCEYCEQDLSEAMLEKMRVHAGPWYVLEHVRPFPGVSLERVIRQIRRGLIVETSIVRGPSSDYQWRFAVETPGLCRYFGKCWKCHADVAPSDTSCAHCLSHLSFEKPRPDDSTSPGSVQAAEDEESRQPPLTGTSRTVTQDQPGDVVSRATHPDLFERRSTHRSPSAELQQLSAALGRADLPMHEPVWDDPPRVAGIRATWIVAIFLVIVIAALLILTESRKPASPMKQAPAPSAVLPKVIHDRTDG